MSDEIRIRAIAEADLHAYRTLRLEGLAAHPEAFGSDHDELAGDPESVWMNRIRSSLEGKQSRIFLAQAGRELAGITAVYRDVGVKIQHSANIVSVYVRPQWRGKKLAELMIGEAMKWCAEAGVRIVRLCVTAGNAAAMACYKRCGFVECGLQREVIRVGEVYYDEVAMWRRI